MYVNTCCTFSLFLLSLYMGMKPCRQNRNWLLNNIVFSPQERIDLSYIAHFLKCVVHCFFRFRGNLFTTNDEKISLKQLWKKHKPWAMVSSLRQLTWVKPRNTRKVWQYWPLSTFPNLWDPLTGGCKGGIFQPNLWHKLCVACITYHLSTGTIQLWQRHRMVQIEKQYKIQKVCATNCAFQASVFPFWVEDKPGCTMQAGQLKYLCTLNLKII